QTTGRAIAPGRHAWLRRPDAGGHNETRQRSPTSPGRPACARHDVRNLPQGGGRRPAGPGPKTRPHALTQTPVRTNPFAGGPSGPLHPTGLHRSHARVGARLPGVDHRRSRTPAQPGTARTVQHGPAPLPGPSPPGKLTPTEDEPSSQRPFRRGMPLLVVGFFPRIMQHPLLRGGTTRVMTKSPVTLHMVRAMSNRASIPATNATGPMGRPTEAVT